MRDKAYQHRRGAVSVVLMGALLVPALAFALGTAVVSVGGGTWSYGTSITSSYKKRVWSNYYHPSRYHTSTVKLGTLVRKDAASAGTWSAASLEGPLVYTGYAYWGTP